MFIIIEKENYHIDFYEGKTYRSKGDIYHCICSNKAEAKIYKSYKIAKNVCNKLNMKTGREFEVCNI